MVRFREVLVAVVSVACVASVASEASAQPGPPPGVPGPSRPVFSPYLNLVRRDASPAINYYGIVRPQIAAYNAIQSTQQQLSQLRQAEAQVDIVTGLPVTGQPSYFLNTGGYFLNHRAGGGPVNSSVTTRPTLGNSPTPGRPMGRTR
ncbi:MAG: hypothetical protein L0241_07765 [Planctomycetia bacterium]|nr:hypothetical protein [Planctomycetia bacterium]